MKKTAKLIILSAPSGAGKTTLVHHLMKKIPNLAFSISAASRKPRLGEVDGQDYYFITTQEFRKKIEQNLFVEWEEVYENHFYGTLLAEVERLRNEGKNVVFDVDVKGGLNIKKIYGKEALAIFIKPPSIEVLKERLRKRSTEDKENLKKRLDRAEEELAFAPKFDVVVVNDDLETAKKEVVQTVKNFLYSS